MVSKARAHPRMPFIKPQSAQDGPTHSSLMPIRRKTRVRGSLEILNLKIHANVDMKIHAKYILFYFLYRLPPQKSKTLYLAISVFT